MKETLFLIFAVVPNNIGIFSKECNIIISYIKLFLLMQCIWSSDSSILLPCLFFTFLIAYEKHSFHYFLLCIYGKKNTYLWMDCIANVTKTYWKILKWCNFLGTCLSNWYPFSIPSQKRNRMIIDHHMPFHMLSFYYCVLHIFCSKNIT